jgi:hypothetical protein
MMNDLRGRRAVMLCLAAGACAGVASAQMQPMDPPRAGQPGIQLPPPAPVTAARIARFGEPTPATMGMDNPPIRWGNQDDAIIKNVKHNVELSPGEIVFQPSGRNEPFGRMLPELGGVGVQAPAVFQEFNGSGINGWTPADPDIGVGGESVCQVVNDDYLVYDKCGNLLFSRDANDLFGFDTSYQFYDPKICFDPWNSKWIMLWHVKRNSDQYSRLFLAVSRSNVPIGMGSGTTTGWYHYQYNWVQDAGTADASFADYYDLGYSDDHVYVGGDQFRFSGAFRWSRMAVWVKSEIYSAATSFTSNHFNFNNPDGSAMRLPRAVKQQVAFANWDGAFINSRRTGGNRLTRWTITDPFGANTRSGTDIAVADYDLPLDCPQPSGALLDSIDCRLMPAVQGRNADGSQVNIFTGLNEKTTFSGDTTDRTCLRLFAIQSNNTVLLDRVFGAVNLYYWFPSPAADYSGNAIWVFSRSGSGTNPEARYVEWSNGTFSNAATTFRTGTGSYGNSGTQRWGDYFGGQLDWDDYYNNNTLQCRMWVNAMYAIPGSWGTSIASTSLFSKGVLSVTNVNLSAVGPQGGPFAPTSNVYTLTNTGQTGLRYTVSDNATWLTENVTESELYDTPDSDAVTVSLTAAANALTPGVYNATVTFTDCSNGGAVINRPATLTVRPRNDACANAITIGPGTFAGSTTTASSELGDVSSCTSADTIDVWYRYVARCDGTVTATTCGGTTDFDTSLAVYNSCVAGQIACNDDDFSCPSSIRRSTVQFTAQAGQDYYIRVAGFSGTTGNFTLRVTNEVCPADFNNDCQVDFFDYLDFTAAFDSEDPSADWNGDNQVDFFDYLDFTAAFDACA